MTKPSNALLATLQVHYVYMPDSAVGNATLFLENLPTDEEARSMAARMVLASRNVMTDGAKCYWLRFLFHYADTFGFKLSKRL